MYVIFFTNVMGIFLMYYYVHIYVTGTYHETLPIVLNTQMLL